MNVGFYGTCIVHTVRIGKCKHSAYNVDAVLPRLHVHLREHWLRRSADFF